MRELEAAQHEIVELKEKLAETQRQLEVLLRHVFGKKSEQTPAPVPGQMDLELALEDAAIESAPAVKPGKAKGGSRKGRKMRAALLPEHLPVEETVIVPLAVQAAPERWRRISEEVVERLERIPGKLIRQRLVRPTYVNINEPYAPPVTAPAPRQLIEGSFFGPQFMADMVLGKYLYHQPLYRQAKGIEWESGVPAFHGHDVPYTWDQSKEAVVAERIVPDWFRGILQTDGGSELGCFLRGGKGRQRPPPEIIRAGCWAHVRRKFLDGAKAGCALCARLLKIINVLYRIEGIARESGCTPEQRLALRQRRARKVIAGLRRRMDAIIREERPRSPVAKACLYAAGQWEGLVVYLEHGIIEIDNNSVENAIRPCALGKKNWLFIGDMKAGPRCATLYSLLGSCLRRGLNPRNYLHWLFERLPYATTLTVDTLTPAAYASLPSARDPQPAQSAA